MGFLGVIFSSPGAEIRDAGVNLSHGKAAEW
jgi:hypothetical protein